MLDAIQSGFSNFLDDKMAIKEKVVVELRKLDGAGDLEPVVQEWLK